MTIADINDKIAKNVTESFNKMNNTAVKGYKKTETTAVNLWERTENFFVNKLFAKDGESTQEAKERLQNKD